VKRFHVYILASRPRGATFIGVTGDIEHRLQQHRSGEGSAYVRKWSIYTLVYLEEYKYVNDAIAREKQLKKWRKAWKFDLIEKANPNWVDIFDTLWLD
jgi:putative endonuclease